MQVNRYNASVSGTLTGSWTSSISPITSSSWTRLSVVLSPSSSEYYTISIADPDGQSNTGRGSAVEATFSVDSIQLISGTTLSPYGYSNQVVINPSSNIPIKLSSINNDSTLTNIFSVYTDGGILGNYFYVKKQSKINDIYFGAKNITNISIGDFNSTHQKNTSGNNINIGISTMPFHVSGSNNVLIGTNAGYFLQYGSNNVVIGGAKLNYATDGNVVIADGAGNIRIQADSTGLVTIPGNASVTGKITAASFVGNGAGLTGITVTASATGSITIGSTLIPLNTTTASLGGLTKFDLTDNTSFANFSVLTQAPNIYGGPISLKTQANSSGTGTSTGGGITIETTSTATNTSGAGGGSINIQTNGNSSGVAIAQGGNIDILTSKSGSTGTSGSISIISNNKFLISAIGNSGSIDNFRIGATTPRDGNFSDIGLISPGTGYFTSGSFTSLTISNYATITLGTTPTAAGLVIKNQYLNQTANLFELKSYTSSVAIFYFDNDANLFSNRTASFTKNVTASAFVGNGSLLTNITASNISGTVASATNSSSAGYAASAGYLPVSGLSASTITIGSTAIGLGSTTASLGGITSVSISSGSANPLTVTSGVAQTNSTGGTISLSTSANATINATPTGGNINISTSAAGSGMGLAGGGNITIQTTATGTGTPGNITISAASGFTPGTINNFNIGATTPGTGNFTELTISGSSVATQAYANSASLNAYNLAIANSFSASNTITNSTGTAVTLNTLGLNTGGTSSALGGAINITTLAQNVGSSVSASSGAINITTTAGTGSAYSTVGGNINIKTLSATGSVNTAGNIIIASSGGFTISSSSVGSIDNFNIGDTNPGTGNFTSLAINGASVATQSYVSSSAYNNTSASVGYAASVGSVIVGGILNSSSTNFNLLSTPNTITAFSAASSLTIGFQNNGTSIMNIGPGVSGIGNRTLNLFANAINTAGSALINIGASTTSGGVSPQTINLGNTIGTSNTINIGGSTSTTLTLNATTSVTGTLTTASITATSASVSGTVTAASFVGSGAGLTGLMGALVYSASFASASAISFNNVFSSSYTNYKIIINFSAITYTGSTYTPIKFAFRAAGVDSLGAGTYNSVYQGYSSFTSGYTASSFSNTSFIYGPSAAVLNVGANLVLEAYGPATTTSRKEVVSQSYQMGNPGGSYTLSHTGYNTSASAFDGFSLLSSSSNNNYTGTIKIYGYNN